MRNFCFTLLSIVLMGTAWGQVSSDFNRSRIPSPALSKKKPTTINYSAAKMSLWSSDFSNMNDWVIGNSAGNNNDWIISNQAQFWWSGNSPIASTSGGNAASFNSDSYATADNQTENNAWIQNATPINCSGHNGVELTFEQFYSKWTSQTIVSVSSDNGQYWTDFEVNSSMIGNEETSNPSLVTVNISSAAGNESSVLIRILFLSNGISDGGTDNTDGVANDYGWIVDDFELKTLPNNDIALLDAWHADVVHGYEYSMVPLAQVREMVPTLVVQNQGSMHQNVDIKCTISGDSGVINVVDLNHTVLFGNTDTLYFNSGFIPTAIDEYEVSFSIPSDDDPSNDSINALPLRVTDFVMGHDYNSVSSFGWNPQSTNQDIVDMASGVHSWGNLYEMEADQTLYSVGVRFAAGNTEWLNVKIRVQQVALGGTIQGPLVLINEKAYSVPPSAIGGGITNISFSSPSILLAGRSYIIDVIKVDTATTNQALFLGGSELGSEDDDFSTIAFGPYGTGPSNYYTNWSFAPAVRANFSQSLSIDENELSEIVISPNPSSGIFQIADLDPNEKTITVQDLAGKVILTKTMESSTSIDLSQARSGMYLVTISNDSSSVVKRVLKN